MESGGSMFENDSILEGILKNAIVVTSTFDLKCLSKQKFMMPNLSRDVILYFC